MDRSVVCNDGASGMDTTARKALETPLQRVRRVNNTPSRAAHPPFTRLPVRTKRLASACALPERAPHAQKRLARSPHVPRDASVFAPSRSADVHMASPHCFHIGTAPTRRAETPLQRHHRVHNIRRATPARAPRPCDGISQPPPPARDEPFVSPSLRARFPVSVQSAVPRVATAKTRLAFESDDSAPLLSTARVRSAPATPARRKNPRLDALLQRIQHLMRDARWREALTAIDEALALDPGASTLQMNRAVVHNRLVIAATNKRKKLEADAAMKQQREAERARLRSTLARRGQRTLYGVLQVRTNATSDEIRRSYRVLVRLFHPDKDRSATRDDEIKCITEAYRVLSDPVQRRSYDASLAHSTQ